MGGGVINEITSIKNNLYNWHYVPINLPGTTELNKVLYFPISIPTTAKEYLLLCNGSIVGLAPIGTSILGNSGVYIFDTTFMACFQFCLEYDRFMLHIWYISDSYKGNDTFFTGVYYR